MRPELRESVLRRDGRCVLAIRDERHVCRDVWGEVHESDDLDKLTIEHIKRELMMGRKAPDDPTHLVALDGYRNVVRPMTKDERAWTRDYLRSVT